MRLFTTASCITLNVALGWLMPQLALGQESSDCSRAIAAAQRRIETGRNVKVRLLTIDLKPSYSDYPTGRPDSYTFAMEGSAAPSVMNSPQLIKAIANQVINNCQSVGLIRVAVYSTDWTSTIGIFPDGNIDFFKCLEFPGIMANESNRLKWGEFYCN